jgi:pimeloyl-ACP methyl ester carboxylesterase
VPPVYLQDVQALLQGLALDRFILFGTSLGGILTMFLAALYPGQLKGALLNDIGPVIEPAGLARIRTYVGRGGNFPTWLHAARAIQETQRAAFPDYELEDWLAMAKRQCRVTQAGRVVFDYDMKIAEPLRVPGNESVADPWPALDGLKAIPTLLVRGALSDILAPATAAEMGRRLPLMEEVLLPHVGHAPMLDEPQSIAGIDRLLARVSKP